MELSLTFASGLEHTLSQNYHRMLVLNVLSSYAYTTSCVNDGSPKVKWLLFKEKSSRSLCLLNVFTKST